MPSASMPACLVRPILYHLFEKTDVERFKGRFPNFLLTLDRFVCYLQEWIPSGSEGEAVISFHFHRGTTDEACPLVGRTGRNARALYTL